MTKVVAGEDNWDKAIKLLVAIKQEPGYNTTGRGKIKCTVCDGNVMWWTEGNKRHLRAKCETPGCLALME